jgi:hypothetical protein
MSEKEPPEFDSGDGTPATPATTTPTAPSGTWSGWPHRPVYFDGDGLLCLRLLCGDINDLAATRSELYRKAVSELQDRFSAEFSARWSTSAEVAAYAEASDRLSIACRDLDSVLAVRKGIKARRGAAILAKTGKQAAAALSKAKEELAANTAEVSSLRELVNELTPACEAARSAARAKREQLLRELCAEAFAHYDAEVQDALKALCAQGGLLDRLAVALRTCGMSDALESFLRPPELPPVPVAGPAAFDLPEFEESAAYTPPPDPPPDPPRKPARPRHPADEFAVVDGGRMRRGFVSYEEAEDYASGRPGATVRKISGPGSMTESSWAGAPADDHE